MKDDNIKVKNINVYAKAGRSIYSCLQSALMLAVKTNNLVILTFNDKEYKIDAKKILKQVIEQ